MRRTYISPEFNYNKIHGTFNMLENSAFFGSKMLEIEDVLNVLNKNILYYQADNKEQIDPIVEANNTPIIYNTVADKKSNHSLVLDESQSETDKQLNTKWLMQVNLNTILSNYIFAIMKESRTFQGVKNSMTLSNDVDIALKDYIAKNVVTKYRFTNIELYLKYRDLKSQNILRYKNDFSELIESEENKVKKIQSNVSYDGTLLTINFKQEQPSNNYSFEYYYNLYFDKI